MKKNSKQQQRKSQPTNQQPPQLSVARLGDAQLRMRFRSVSTAARMAFAVCWLPAGVWSAAIWSAAICYSFSWLVASFV